MADVETVIWEGKVPTQLHLIPRFIDKKTGTVIKAIQYVNKKHRLVHVVMEDGETSILGEAETREGWRSCTPSVEAWMYEEFIKGKLLKK